LKLYYQKSTQDPTSSDDHVSPTSQVHVSAILFLLMQGITMYEVGVTTII